MSNIKVGVQTRTKLRNLSAFYLILSNIVPMNVYEALADFDWVTAVQEELHEF